MLITLARSFQFVDAVVCYQYVIPYRYTGFFEKKVYVAGGFYSIASCFRAYWVVVSIGRCCFFRDGRFRYAAPRIANNGCKH